MPRHTFLDSIFNRPSQSYSAPSAGGSGGHAQHQWLPPNDLPNVAPSSSHGSFLGGSMFKRKGKTSMTYSSMTSDAGASTSTLGLKSRFGRKKRDSIVTTDPSFYIPPRSSAPQTFHHAPPASVADSQASESKRKNRWWEAGSLGVGRRNRTSSIAGDSIFSEPEPQAGQVPWTSHGLAGIGAGSKQGTRARSDYGTSPTRQQFSNAPPLPTNRSVASTSMQAPASPPGRLPSNVAPLGTSTLNPTLQQKPSKTRLASHSSTNLRKAASTAQLPTPANPPMLGQQPSRLPGSLASSPHVRRTSQDSKRGTTDGADWRDFVNSLSGTNISKAWEGHRDGPSMASVAAKDGTNANVERRRSHYERIQKELQQDAQFEQTVRDSGIVHQDLLSRAASQVVGSPPADEQREALGYVGPLQPGAVIQTRQSIEEQQRSLTPQRPSPVQPQASLGPSVELHRASPALESSHSRSSKEHERGYDSHRSEEHEEDSSDEGDESEEESNDDSIVPKQTMLEVVREEDEDSSSQGTLSRRQTLKSINSIELDNPVVAASKFKAFESALNKSRYSTSSISTNAMPMHSPTSNTLSLRSESLADSKPSDSTPRHRASASNLAREQVDSGENSHDTVMTAPETQLDVDVASEQSSQLSSATEEEEDSHPPTPIAKSLRRESIDLVKQGENAVDSDSRGDDEEDKHSQTSVQTGRATVTFEKQSKPIDADDDAKSTRSTATSRISRPPTLQRRLSDVSLGTSFGVSNIMHIGRSRPSSRAASSRRMKMSDDDNDSAGSRSEGEDDEELRAKIKAEQERLRNMKVGDDFFGGSLSAILDKFDSKNWEDGLSSAVEQLGLDVGTSAKKRDSITAQDVLSLNAQERINEVRRLRADAAASPSRRNDVSDARTMESGKAPSFAALWLLNQVGEDSKNETEKQEERKVAPIDLGNETATASHARTLSSASNQSDSSAARSPTAPSKIRSMLSNIGTTSTQSPEKKQSIMDRPRNRGPKPREMGGVSIARGKLVPDAKVERPEDVRNTLSDIWVAQTLSQMKEEKASRDAQASTTSVTESEPASSPPSSPLQTVPLSKDKPAPLKSAIKGGAGLKHSRSLADTLFSFQVNKDTSGKGKQKEKGKNKERSVKYGDDKKAKEYQSPRTGLSVEASAFQKKTSETKTEQTKDATPVSVDFPDVRKAAAAEETERKPTVQAIGTPESGISSLPVRPQNPNLQDSDSDSEDDDDDQYAETAPPVEDDLSPSMSTLSPPPASDLWSSESAVSTGPATPGIAEYMDRTVVGLSRDANHESFASPRDKKLPLPPVPSFPDDVQIALVDHDMTPLAVPYAEPAFNDLSKTPRAEKDEPSFGVNLIPPTPPATDVEPHMVKVPAVRTPATLAEEDPLEATAERRDEAQRPSLQRSSSARSKGTGKGQSGEIKRRGSAKRKSNTTLMQAYQGQGLSLPPGLVATTVATTASKRQSQGGPASEEYEISQDPTAKSRRTKSKSKGKEKNQNQLDVASISSSPRGAESFVSAPEMQPSLSAGLASLSLPTAVTSGSGSSARGSDGPLGASRTTSSSHSPAVSVSDHSSALSSAISSSAASDASSSRGGVRATKHTANGVQYPRNISSVTATANGHARTSLMSAISEWENSPVGIDRSSASASPMPMQLVSGYSSPVGGHMSGHSSPMYHAPSSVTRSQSSVYSGSMPSVVRNAPIGAPTSDFLHPSNRTGAISPGANRRLSMPLSENGYAAWNVGGSYAGQDSDVSLGAHSQQSTTSLPNVPQSSYRARDPLKASNAIDDRLYAKTTMSTVAVTSGAFRNKSLRHRRSSVDVHQQSESSSNGRRGSFDSTNNEGMLVEELQKTTMSLTSHSPPPRKLSSTQVLVHVIACAIDEMDKLLLREKVRNGSGYGFVPGRSFCGRVMETGWEVKRMRIGDIVFGLQSSRKCGALAEFMTIEEDLVAKAPQDCLTMEQIAALPSVGVMAHQLMVNHCSQLKRGSRILILNAHDGVGLLTMQACSNLGLIIVAHCPNNVSDGVPLCEANGAHEVIVGDVLWALNTLHESSFDLVVDTIGGRRIYDASRRILAYEGQFCTCYGDMQNAVANPNLRSHLRSLRRSFFKKDTKQLGYEWVGTDTAEDCREALEAVRRAAEDGAICPRLKSVLAFAEAPRAFESTLRGTEDEPGATVVRIS